MKVHWKNAMKIAIMFMKHLPYPVYLGYSVIPIYAKRVPQHAVKKYIIKKR